MTQPAVSTSVSYYLMLASAIAGRRLSVHETSKQPSACCDGQSIYIPNLNNRNGRQGWEDVIAQASLVGAGSLQPQLIRRLIGRRNAAQRYCYLEVLRGQNILADRLPQAFLSLAEIAGSPALTKDAQESLQWALSHRRLPETPAYFGSVRPLMIVRQSVKSEKLSTLLSNQEDEKSAYDSPHTDHQTDDGDEDIEQSKLLKLFNNPLLQQGALADFLRSILGVSSASGDPAEDEGSGGAEIPISRVQQVLRRGVHAVLSRLPIELPTIDADVESSTRVYPEWDQQNNQYKLNWVLLEEVAPWRLDGPRDITDCLKPATRELKRQLAALGLDHEMHRRQTDGPELDSDRLLDCAIDLATGHTPPSLDIYRASRRSRRDLAVTIAIDISGSTEERNDWGVSGFDQQLTAAYQLGRALDELGDTVALFGFHSWGRKLVRTVRIKGAEERWGAQVQERMAQLEPVGYTRIGAAIRHGARMLESRVHLPNRLLLLITDGIAFDQGYEFSYATADARMALAEARAKGTAVVCLCVGGSQELDKLQDVFGAANLLVVDTPQQIATTIGKVCQQALAAVSKRRFKPIDPDAMRASAQ